ncbi:MAG: hypothetical protein AB1898_31065 [Acidobacteriota bacterium]
MSETLRIVLAGLVTVLLGFTVGPLLEFATSRLRPRPPTGIAPVKWNEIIAREEAGAWIGLLERFVALASFWIPAYSIIGGWLAFKLAAKWEAWANIVKVPSSLPKIPEFDYFRSRRQLGSYILSRFLLGTLSNVLIGLLAWYFGQCLL